MNHRIRHSLIVMVAALGGLPHCGVAQQVDFNDEVRPILAAHCYACHGPDAESREADLRLDTPAGAAADLGGYAAIKPGDPGSSAFIVRIETDDEDEIMPPLDSEHELSDAQKLTLRRWIAQGAQYDVHWAFVPPVGLSPSTESPSDHIDTLIRKQLALAGLTPNEPADRYELIRRVTLDLIGLPPTPEQADAFVADASPRAFEKVVDRLLVSDSYGEHWARMWLDLARYADTKGYEKDNPREIWRYRDWVINALNQDMPYDQFTIHQLAGDLLPDATDQQRLATAFHRNTLTNEEGGTDDEEFRVLAVKDRVDTTIQVWMGLTMGCAKCHSHKYDPISQEEYYQLFAIFNQTADADREAPLMASPTAEQLVKEKSLREKVAVLQAKLDSGGDGLDQGYQKQIQELNKSLADLRKGFSATPIMQELPSDKARETRIHRRGNFLDLGEVVEPGVPTAFGTFGDDAPKDRLAAARWIMDDSNPLVARVMVNRIWARLFGAGIVETEEDFGTQGLPPSHPQLLDALASEYREQGWSTKQLLKTIVMSSTYQQSSRVREEHIAVDPRNRLIGRGPRFRLSAETIRDSALAASGLLTHKIGGPSVMPPQPDGVWKSTYSARQWISATGDDRYRRGLYTYWKRTSPYPAMTTFDAGSGEVCLIRRIRTNTPLQALITMNDPAYLEAAGALALRMKREGLASGFRRVLTRPPTEQETARLTSLFSETKVGFQSDLASAVNLAESAGLDRITSDAELAAWVTVANVLLNLDETLTKP